MCRQLGQFIRLREEASKPKDVSDLDGEAAVRAELVRLRSLFRVAMAVLTTAIEAALGEEQWDGVTDVLVMCDDPEAGKYLLTLLATKLVQDGEHAKAVTMYTRAGRWTEAYAVADTSMSESEKEVLFASQAQRMETAGQYEQAAT